MKNIHVIATDKPSRLFKDLNNKINITDIEMKLGNKQHIYITSDEDIKYDEYYLGEDNNIYCLVTTVNYNGKKIILTTDQDLIKDGVQAIDDEFLEWFIKNPSCEDVEVRDYMKKVGVETDANGWREMDKLRRFYEIIIPKEEPKQQLDEKGNPFTFWGGLQEEPKKVLTEEDIFNQKDIDAVTDYINKEQQKQHLIDMMKDDEELGLYGEVHGKQGIALTSDYIQNIGKEIKLEEPKQETLEEAAEKYNSQFIRQNEFAIEDFINGAKWQAEQIGKPEFLQKLRGTLSDAEARRLIFEQFKKK